MTTDSQQRDATATTGTNLLNWPTHLDSYGGNGTSVYAAWPEADDETTTACFPGLYLNASVRESPLGDQAPWKALFPELHNAKGSGRSVDLLGVLLLGTSNGSWVHRTPGSDPAAPITDCYGDFWTASTEDLTIVGTAVLDSLSTAYRRPPVLLTLLDT
ncbi:MAG: hypothetical protein HOV68_13105 [Streptomycetaceae bacterium]|nr:hypothetical protein [Streptomycetaceae bacterium]